MNRKKPCRLYSEQGLAVPRRRGRKAVTGTRAPMALPDGPNQPWSLDFVSDAPDRGRRFRILAIVDNFTRKALALGRTSRSAAGAGRGSPTSSSPVAASPASSSATNGTEMTSRAIPGWTNRPGLAGHCIAPGKPTQNAFAERFQGRMRDECLL